jgi:quinol monooxygenase YgiN
MAIIIAGTLDFDPAKVEQMLRDAAPMIRAGQAEPGCIAYDWAIDPNVPGRVLVFEHWVDEAALAGHFAGVPYREMGVHLNAVGIVGFAVSKFRTDLQEPVYDEAGTPRADFFTARR